jgi:hypothetical protein
MYRCFFQADSLEIARHEFEAAGDNEALQMAREVYLSESKGSRRGFQLWQGDRRVHTELPNPATVEPPPA